MKKTILCLAGWAQKHDSLSHLFKASSSELEVINFDYSRIYNVDAFFQEIQKQKINPDIVVGWSLGGQLACRLITNKIISPKNLILIAAPFQFVKSSKIAAAMPQKSFNEFRHNFVSNPSRTLKKFASLMNINDKNAQELVDNLDITDDNHEALGFWLDELERFSCHDIDFSNFPQTTIFHGASDLVVHPSQGKIFQEIIKDSTLDIIPNCGHTPHISYQDVLIKKIFKLNLVGYNK
jgi:pimeloyl-ACP methyl ester carboxylesterase